MGHDVGNDQWTSYIVFVFTGVRTTTDRIIDLLSVGEEVHVDVGIFDTVCPDNNGVLYSSYVGKPVRKTLALENNYNETIDKLLVSNVTREQGRNALAMLDAVVEAQVMYNTRDLLFCTFPKMFTDVFLKDITSVGDIKSVFCSQLAALASRELKHVNDYGYEELHPLAMAAYEINSRAVSPARLKKVISPFCQRAKLRKFMNGSIEFVNH